jgi:branched-chain amino acid transport system ATP-binding protein
MVAGYGGVAAVRGINLTVKSGEIVVLLGANGAGKTTTLRALLGVIPCQSGAVLYKGSATHLPFHKRIASGVGYVPEGRSVFMQLSVAENLLIGRGGVERAIGLFPELKDHLKRRAGDLSGGQQQMLSLARVLASEPEILIADELSMGLAPVIVRRLMATLVAAASQGVAVLFVEQHAHVALEIADRAYVLRRGNVVLEGDSSSLRERYDELQRLYLAEGTQPDA